MYILAFELMYNNALKSKDLEIIAVSPRSHHKIFADKLERVASGKLKRLIVNMPPRHTKSEFASYLFPAWVMGRDPHTKII